MREDYNEAYGWALMWYEKNPNYTRGIDVILEIREKFQGLGLEYIEKWVEIKDDLRQAKADDDYYEIPFSVVGQ